MEKNGVEVVEYGGEIWINQTHLQKNDDFNNTDQYWYYGEACSSRTNVCHRSYTSREPFSPLFRVCHVNVG